MRKLSALVACEFSGVVRDALIALGVNAVSCDLLPSETPGPHVVGNVIPLLRNPWDLVIAFPPCTYLTAARLPWKFRDPLWNEHTREGAALFRACLDANAPCVAVENPKMHALARDICGFPTQAVHPWEHGHSYTKRTHLWLRRLPPLMATLIVEPTAVWVYAGKTSPGRPRREGMHRDPKTRGLTFPGVGAAMAEQWVPHVRKLLGIAA